MISFIGRAFIGPMEAVSYTYMYSINTKKTDGHNCSVGCRKIGVFFTEDECGYCILHCSCSGNKFMECIIIIIIFNMF